MFKMLTFSKITKCIKKHVKKITNQSVTVFCHRWRKKASGIVNIDKKITKPGKRRGHRKKDREYGAAGTGEILSCKQEESMIK